MSRWRKGEEMGWFQHGSTIIVFAPDGFTLAENVRQGDTIRVGEPLLRVPHGSHPRPRLPSHLIAFERCGSDLLHHNLRR